MTAADPPDDTASLLAELRRLHAVELYDARRAHEFVWQQARAPFELCVFELSDRADAAFAWPYLLHYRGIVHLRSATGPWRRRDALALALAGARLAVVGDRHAAVTLADEFPEARIRYAPIGVAAPASGAAMLYAEVPLFGSRDTVLAGRIRRAADRAREAGSRLELRIDAAAALPDADVVIALHWPPGLEPPVAAIAAMAAGRPAIVHETGAAAAWPALDPQTWQPRGSVTDAEPVVVSIDPRDEEHSLMLAMRRLAADGALRRGMGDAGHAWWKANATPAHAAAAWTAILAEAAAVTSPPRPSGWPAGFPPDGTRRLRELLAPFGVSVDFLA